MSSTTFLLLSGFVTFTLAYVPHKGPKVSGSQLQEQFGQYVSLKDSSNSQLQQPFMFQPQPVQYIQQPHQYQYQPIPSFVPQQQYQTNLQPVGQSEDFRLQQHMVQPQQFMQGPEQLQALQYQSVKQGPTQALPLQYQHVRQTLIPTLQYVPVEEQSVAQQPKVTSVEQKYVSVEEVQPVIKNAVNPIPTVTNDPKTSDEEDKSHKYRSVSNRIDVRTPNSRARQINYAYPSNQGVRAYEDRLVNSVVKNAPTGSLLIGARANGASLPALRDRLISNYTQIRPDSEIKDTFSCEGREYGYYADVDNECQIFHVCLPIDRLPYPPLKENEAAPPSVTYTFSFICPFYTIFSQDVLVCAWEREAIPCSSSAQLYSHVNGRFFEAQKTSDYGERYQG